jgi:hypothetical protein
VVILIAHELRDYDAATGALLHTWPLPDVSAGVDCKSVLNNTCPALRLTLEDAAHGLVAYSPDNQVHLLRLSDGADAIIGPAALARFMDEGLVYANGSKLKLVAYDQLPLH